MKNSAEESLPGSPTELPSNSHSPQQQTNIQEIKTIVLPSFIANEVRQQRLIWEHEESTVPESIRSTWHDFMSECYELMLKIMRQKGFGVQKIMANKPNILNILQSVHKLFLNREMQIATEEGILNLQYRFCWLTLTNQLWNEFFHKNLELSEAMLANDFDRTENFIKVLLILRREDSEQESPMFSEDSFNPNIYEQNIRRKMRSCRLEELISEQQIGKMKGRILQIKNPSLKQELFHNLEITFRDAHPQEK